MKAHLVLLAFISLACLLTSCKQGSSEAPGGGGDISVALSDSITNLVPRLGWSESGEVGLDVLTAESITVQGRKLTRVLYAPPITRMGRQSYTVAFEDDAWRVSITANADSPGEAFVVQSLMIGLQWSRQDPLDLPALQIWDDIIVGRSQFHEIPKLDIGQPRVIYRESIEQKLEWTLGDKSMMHLLRLHYDGMGILSIAQWMNWVPGN